MTSHFGQPTRASEHAEQRPCRRATRRAGWPRRAAAAALATLAALAATSATAAAETPVLIEGAPMEARALADLVYPLRTRAIVMKPEPTPFGILVQFDLDSATVKPASRPYLDEVGKMLGLRRLEGKRLRIVGHADASGDEPYNQELSERRAAAVAQYLARHHGVGLDRLDVGGRGESEPLDPADPFDPRNRRVQFHPIDDTIEPY